MIGMKCGGRLVGGSIRVARTFSSRFAGLMFRKKLPEGSGLLLMPCTGIHMCFMRMALDIVYLDGFFRVLDVERSLRPWRVGKQLKKTRLVLELPAGTIDRCGIGLGQTLSVCEPAAESRSNPQEKEMPGYERTSSCCES